MSVFAGKPSVRILTFLYTLNYALYMVGVRVVAEVLVLAYFLEVEIREILLDQMGEAEEEFESRREMIGTWKDI